MFRSRPWIFSGVNSPSGHKLSSPIVIPVFSGMTIEEPLSEGLHFGRGAIITSVTAVAVAVGYWGARNKLGIPASKVINSHFYAEINPEKCLSCGICADERCQVKAIEEGEEAYRVNLERCIGCGLCIRTCSGEAITLVHKDREKMMPPPVNEEA
jgi:NAD-dependent dihydropyrimidine dehydrogenase PreA subunit